MRSRLKLQTLLETLLGSRNVYFQPPTNLKMQYPCIVYSKDVGSTRFADDNPYMRLKRYSVTYIDPNPDSEMPDKIAELPMCIQDRPYVADNLNHDVYKLYY